VTSDEDFQNDLQGVIMARFGELMGYVKDHDGETVPTELLAKAANALSADMLLMFTSNGWQHSETTRASDLGDNIQDVQDKLKEEQ